MPSINNIPPFYRPKPPRPSAEMSFSASGVSLLPSTITINGQTETAKLRYVGNDASASGWTAEIGDNLPAVGSGGLFNIDTPFLDGTVGFSADGTRGFQDDTTDTGVIGTDDFVIELVVKMDGGSAGFFRIFRTNPTGGGGNARVSLATHASNNNGLIQITDSSNTTNASWGSMTNGVWYHLLVFADRSGNVRGYRNGSGAAAQSISAVGGLNDAGFALADAADFPGEIALAQMWTADAWLDSATQNAVATERFRRLCGIYPEFAKGSSAPITATRSGDAYLDRYVDANTRQLFRVGRNWLRTVERKDSNGDTIKGYLAEDDTTNLCLQSEDLSTTWTVIDAGDTIDTNADTAPNGETTADGIIADSTDSQHGVSQDITLTAVRHTFSCWAKAGDQDWLYLQNSTVADADCYFDLANGVVGTEGAGIVNSFIEDWGGGRYRCGFSYEGTVASHTHRVQPAAADGDNTFAGDGATVNTYVWGVQVEALPLMTSYVPTTTVAVARDTDDLVFDATGNAVKERGTMVIDVLLLDHDMVSPGYCLLDIASTTTDRVTLQTMPTGKNSRLIVSVDSESPKTQAAIEGSAVVNGEINTLRATWQEDDFELLLNGVSDGTDTSGTTPDAFSTIDIGQFNNGSLQMNGVISNVRIFSRPTKKG